MIDSNIIDKIFEPRFATKSNTKKDNEFGLAIVKEIENILLVSYKINLVKEIYYIGYFCIGDFKIILIY